jgi:hypothetical protein
MPERRDTNGLLIEKKILGTEHWGENPSEIQLFELFRKQ